MKIGLDFDNTLVSYDSVFHKVAVERGYIGADAPVSKLYVRNTLRSRDEEDLWTEMQGHVYGTCMADASVFPGVLQTLHWARENSIYVAIISHKTRYPFLGPQYDLHRAAREWIESFLRDTDGPLVPQDDIYFHERKEEKIARIREIGCSDFVDDLPEILTAPGFPAATRRFLFDPEGSHVPIEGVTSVPGWDVLREHLEG